MKSYLNGILKEEIRHLGDAREIFKFYHANNQNIREITIKTIFEVKNIQPEVIPKYPNEKKFAIVLTHDVDLAKPSWKYYSYHLMRKPVTGVKFLIKQQNPYDTFTKIVEIERRFGAKSTFFFLAVDKDPTGVGYNIENLRKTIKMLLDEGFEVALHGSYNAYKDFNQLNREKLRLEKVVGGPVTGYRNHYLRFKIPYTWKLLGKAGFIYDSTLGYNDLAGFRGGFPYPFMAFDPLSENRFKVLEIPLNVMDKTLLGYMKLSVKESFEFVKQLMDIVEKYHGVLTLNWHNDKFDGFYWKRYEDLYVKILKESKKRDAWIISCKELVRWWKNGVS